VPSFRGTDPERLHCRLSFLHQYAQAPKPWRAAPRLTPCRDAGWKRAIIRGSHSELPPSIMDNLRLGAYSAMARCSIINSAPPPCLICDAVLGDHPATSSTWSSMPSRHAHIGGGQGDATHPHGEEALLRRLEP